MPSVDELLNEAEITEATLTEINDVIEIDADTRTMIIPDTERIFGVMSDEKGERKYFRCKRFVGNGIDLSKLDLRVIYQNASGLESGKDKYIVTDLKTDGEDYVTFSWELSRKVTAYNGIISFIVCAIKTGTDGIITNEWNTTLANGVVLDGLEVSGTQEQEKEAHDYSKQLEAELLRVANEQKAEIEANGKKTLESIPKDYTVLEGNVDKLKEDLANLKIKKINVADYGIKDNGEDVADAVLNLIERFKWKNVNLYFPSGTYKFSKPIRFYGRVNVIGEPFAFTATERSRTVFDFSLIDSQESETYCVTCDYFTLFKNITLYSDAYVFTENRNAFLSDRDVMPFVGTVNKQNISGINFDDYGHAENLYMFGFSKTGINMHDYGIAKDITFRSTNEPMIIGTDNIIDNIRFDKCGTCISSMGGENIVTKLRADSIIEKCITVIGGQNQIKDCVFDWVYKNALDIRGNGNVIDISSGRCGIKLYDVNPVTTKLSFSGDNGTNFAVVRLTNSGTYAPKGNKIRISGYKSDVSDDNRGRWLYTPFITIVTDDVSPIQENYFDLSVSDIDLSVESLNAEVYRRFINFFYTTKQFSAMCLLNMIPVKIKNANSDNYATSFKQASYE